MAVARVLLLEAAAEPAPLLRVPERGLDVVGAQLHAGRDERIERIVVDRLLVRGVDAVEQARVGLLDLIALHHVAREQREVREQL